MASTSPKVVIVGAGSYFFGRPVIWNMTHSPVLRTGTLALVDTDPRRLRTMMRLARRAIAAVRAPLTLQGATDHREVLRNADFVVLSFSERNAYFRGLDCEIALRHGIRMCSGDTIGPGGIFRALREVPRALRIARNTARLAPNAWLINYVNPTAVLGIALMRYAPEVRSFAICDGLHEPHCTLRYLKHVDILPPDAESVPPEIRQRLDLRIAGVNHFTWLLRFRYDGRDMMPAWRRAVSRRAAAERAGNGQAGGTGPDGPDAKTYFNANYALRLLDVFGAYPDPIAHIKEYVPFWQGHGVAATRPGPLVGFDAAARQRVMDRNWRLNEDYASGRLPIARFMRQGRGDHATDIIESMWGRTGKPFFINCANRGAVGNMAADAFLELRCDVDLDGPRPQPVGAMPRGLLARQQQVLDTHELTARAAATCDRRALLQAFLTDPLAVNIEDAKAVIREGLERQRDILPAKWYRRRLHTSLPLQRPANDARAGAASS